MDFKATMVVFYNPIWTPNDDEIKTIEFDEVYTSLDNESGVRINHFGVFMLPGHYRRTKVTVRNIYISNYQSIHYSAMHILGTSIDEAIVENLWINNSSNQFILIYLVGFSNIRMGDPSVPNSIDVSNLSIGERVFFFSSPTIVNLYGLRFTNVNAQPETRESLLRFDNLNITTIQIDGIDVHDSYLGPLNII